MYQNFSYFYSAGGFGALIQFVIVVAIIYFLCTCMRGPRRASPGNEGAGYGGSGHATGGGGGGGPGFWSGKGTLVRSNTLNEVGGSMYWLLI